MAEVSRQVREKTLDVFAFSVPTGKSPHSKGVSEVVEAWLEIKPVCTLDSCFIPDPLEGQFGSQVRNRPSVICGQEGGFRRRLFALPLFFEVVTKNIRQIEAHRHES